jgi:hypothetical protein
VEAFSFHAIGQRAIVNRRMGLVVLPIAALTIRCTIQAFPDILPTHSSFLTYGLTYTMIFQLLGLLKILTSIVIVGHSCKQFLCHCTSDLDQSGRSLNPSSGLSGSRIPGSPGCRHRRHGAPGGLPVMRVSPTPAASAHISANSPSISAASEGTTRAHTPSLCRVMAPPQCPDPAGIHSRTQSSSTSPAYPSSPRMRFSQRSCAEEFCPNQVIMSPLQISSTTDLDFDAKSLSRCPRCSGAGSNTSPRLRVASAMCQFNASELQSPASSIRWEELGTLDFNRMQFNRRTPGLAQGCHLPIGESGIGAGVLVSQSPRGEYGQALSRRNVAHALDVPEDAVNARNDVQALKDIWRYTLFGKRVV